MKKLFLLTLLLINCCSMQASDQSTLDRYKIASLSIALISSVGVCLAHLLKADLDAQYKKAHADLPQSPQDFQASLSTHRREQKKLLQRDSQLTEIYRLNGKCFTDHTTNQTPSKARRMRACRKMKALAPYCPEVGMVVKNIEKHDAQCSHDHDCESPDNWNAVKRTRYPCYQLRGPNSDMQHVVANGRLEGKRELEQKAAEIARLTALRPRYQKLAQIETRRAIAGVARVSFGVAALASLGALGHATL